MKGQPVEMDGTVVCYDPAWGQLYVHNGAHAVYLSPRSFTNVFQVGQQVRINGRTTWDGAVPILTNTQATVLAQKALPRALSLRLSDLGQAHGQWIEIQGRVRVAEASRERVTLVVEQLGRKCLVYVLQTSSASAFRQLADAEVKLQGINASRIQNGNLEAGIVFCPGLRQVTVINPPPDDRWQLPVTPIEALLTRKLGSWTNRPVHIAGSVISYQPGEKITLKDPTGVLEASVIQVTPLQLYQRADLWGFLDVRTKAVLADAYFESRNHVSTTAKSSPVTALVNEAPLTEIKQVRSLPKNRADQHLPVSLQGVLTFVDTEWHLAFLQDGTDAIFLDTAQSDLSAGHWVEVNGETDGSGFAPQIIKCSTRILGATHWPEPIKADVLDSINGQLDSKWVELEGVVRRVSKDGGRLSLVLSSVGSRFTATVLDFNTNSAPAHLVDSLVRIRGACGSTVNSRGQINGITLHVPSLSDIRVIDASPADPFSTTPIPIAEVATFEPGRVSVRRVRVKGTVTLVAPGQGIFLQDATSGIRIQSGETDGFSPGDQLDVAGFPTMRDFSPCLEEVTLRREGVGHLPPAKPVNAAQILRSGAHDGLRVEIRAQVLQSHLVAAQPKLILQEGQVIFTSQIIQSRKRGTVRNLSAGSIVKVRGVCVVQGTENNEPGSFRILAPTLEDVVLLEAGPWWTPKHTFTLLGGIAFAAVLTSAWVSSMRRQIRAQTETIRKHQKELLETSRQAGMAEVATSVLHNVGNVLNSVNVSATLVAEQIGRSRLRDVRRIGQLLLEHSEDPGAFLTSDPKGNKVPAYLERLGEHLEKEQASHVEELIALRKNIDHIKDIVATQQSFGRVSGVKERLKPADLVEDALSLNEASLARHQVRVQREYDSHLPAITVERHKVLQILVNLISNARHACLDAEVKDKLISVAVRNGGPEIRISVTDNGVGIPPENLNRIFNLGFTTRKDGHGFGLHSGALAAKELHGQLAVHSDGAGRGATFTLELPVSTEDQ